MMMPPLLRYFWFHSIYSLAASCSLQSAVCKCHTPLLYCKHWHFNSVIENYISGKLVCTVAYCLMTVINQPSSFQSRFLYSKLSYCLLQCGLAWGYSCCFHFYELVTRQSFTSRVSNVIFYCLNLKKQLSYSYHHIIETFAWFCNWSESFHHVWNPFKYWGSASNSSLRSVPSTQTVLFLAFSLQRFRGPSYPNLNDKRLSYKPNTLSVDGFLWSPAQYLRQRSSKVPFETLFCRSSGQFWL